MDEGDGPGPRPHPLEEVRVACDEGVEQREVAADDGHVPRQDEVTGAQGHEGLQK